MHSVNKPLLDIDLLYEWGNDNLTEAHQKAYLRYFENATGTILEIGSGRGVFLRLMKEAGFKAYGIDTSEEAVRHCRDSGLDAIHCDALNHISSLEKGSIGGVFCGHIIEHLQPAHARELLKQCHRILSPGSMLVIITPNSKDLRTTERFWLDMTHVRPYPEKLLTALLKKEGFHNIKTMEDKEPAKNILERVAKSFLRLWFMGYMFRGDLVVIAER